MKMQPSDFNKDGFFGAYFECPQKSDNVLIIMLGDSYEDRLAVTAAKWILDKGCNVLTMSPAKKDYGHHNYPLERFEKALTYLKERGNKHFGIVGASTTGMLALVAASYFSDFSLTIALSPSDFIMEGFYQDGLDGAHERPGNNESTISYHGQPLPYLPFAYRHPEYWQKIQQESKEGKDIIASRKMFEESEKRHPIKEEEKIKVEKIKGKILFVGAKDDVLWDTCKYIQRMEDRLNTLPHQCTYESLIYEHGTHFVFPQSMLEKMIPLISTSFISIAFQAGRKYPKECKKTRIDIDQHLQRVIKEWLMQ